MHRAHLIYKVEARGDKLNRLELERSLKIRTRPTQWFYVAGTDRISTWL